MNARWFLAVGAALLFGCGVLPGGEDGGGDSSSGDGGGSDGGGDDTGGSDTGGDAGTSDTGTSDTGTSDTGGDTGGSDAGGDTGTSDTGGSDAGGDGGGDAAFDGQGDGGDGGEGDGGFCDSNLGTGCNTVTNSGNVIAQVQVASAAPTPAGGTVVEGTYHLTDWTTYTGTGGATGPTGQNDKETLVFSGGTVQIVQVEGDCPERRQNLSVVFSEAMVTATNTCPTCTGNNCGGNAGYTATTTTFVLFEEHGGGEPPSVKTFTKP
jgi:hypothetical protein